jgi:predicted  nucleic acid-binding Zn-ribbon protein
MSDGITDAYRGMRIYERREEIKKELFENEPEFKELHDKIKKLDDEIRSLQFVRDKHEKRMDDAIKKLYKEKYPGRY